MNNSPSSESMIISWEALGTEPANNERVGGSWGGYERRWHKFDSKSMRKKAETR